MKLEITGACYRHDENFNPADIGFNHVETHYELLYFMSGRANFNIMGEVYPLINQDLILIPPRFYHFIDLKDNTFYERIVVSFNVADEYLPEFLKKPKIFNLKGQKRLANVFERLKDYSMFLSAERFNEISLHLLSEFMTLLSVENISPSPTVPLSTNSTIVKILNMIPDHLHENLSAEFFAKRLYLSPSYIKNTFSENMHIGLKHYINNVRILKAEQLIKSGHKPTSVYTKCGFSSYSTFYRDYKHFTGRYPSEDAVKK